MKRALLITTIILTLGFFIPNPVFAAGACDNVSPPNPNCQELSGGLNSDLALSIQAKDEDGNILAGVNVTFVWSITQPTPTTKLGVFAVNGGNTWTDTNATGKSSVTLKIDSFLLDQVSPGAVRVTATYAGRSVSKVFAITTICNRDPILYYGIAGVSLSGENNFQYSTAEILETCHPEYMLYYGIGEGG